MPKDGSDPTTPVQSEMSSGVRPAKPPGLSVCLYCSSSDTVDPDLLASASEFGAILAGAGVRLVYGGGGVGLMGAAARAAHGAGGRVLGVMPDFLRRRELVYDAVETVITPNMHDRKRLMFDQADAFAVFPGGIGTLEEAIELMSWRRLGLHDKPLVFLNIKGFWNALFAMIEHSVAERVSPDWIASTWTVVEQTADVLPAIRAALDRADHGSVRPDEVAAKS